MADQNQANQIDIRVYSSSQELVSSLAEHLNKLSNDCVSKGTRAHIALSGGSTPKNLFKYLANSDYANSIHWPRLHFWWGDERCVPPDHTDSNYREANELLLKRIDIPTQNIHRIRGEAKAEIEAERFATEMKQHIPLSDGCPKFDWVMLGMGEDGHTASLFPNQTNYQSGALSVIAEHPNSGQQRISLSASLISNAKKISYLVLGESKQTMVQKCLADAGQQDLPAAKIRSKQGVTEWLLDQGAANLLSAEQYINEH